MTFAAPPLRLVRIVPTAFVFLSAVACASGGGNPLPALAPEECARFANGLWPNGVSSVAAFDSLVEVAQSRSAREPEDPEMRMERMPALLNGPAIARFVSNTYPRDLLFARRGGRAMMAVLVTADGAPARVRVFRTSGIGALDNASVFAAEQFRFSPGIFRGCPIYTFVVMPITWDPGAPPQGAR